jgi:hypothetical protein
MGCDELPDDLKILWKETGRDRPVFSPDQLRQQTEQMRAKRRKSDMIGAAVMVIFVASYTIIFFFIPNNALTMAGSILSVLVCGAWLIDILAKRRRVAPDPAEIDSARFYRAELERARDNHRTLVWRLALLAPPFILWDIGFARIFAKAAWFIEPLMWFDCVFLLAVFAVFGPLKHLKSMRKYQDRIAALDSASRSNVQ